MLDKPKEVPCYHLKLEFLLKTIVCFNNLSTGEKDLLNILEEMMSVAAKWEEIGRGFGIDTGHLEQIQSNHPGDCKKCLSGVLTCWLRRNYDVGQFGEPTWQIVVKVVARPVAGDNCALALDIAGRHSGSHLLFVVVYLK